MNKRISSLLMSVAMLISFPLSAHTAALGDELHTAGTDLAEGTALAKGVYWNTSYSDKLAENYIEYTPSYAVTPTVAYGGSILSIGSFSSLAAHMESKGMHVIGGINGDYFVLNTYEPLGLVMSEGIIKSSPSYHEAIGFREDGTAVISKPGIDIRVGINGESYPLPVYNKMRDNREFALFSNDFAATTRNTSKGIDIVLSPMSSTDLTANCSLEMTVESIHQSTGSMTIPSGRLVLSLSVDAGEWRLNAISDVEVGDTITINTSTPNPEWQNVKYALGCFKKLVTNGVMASGLDSTRGPRTAVGIKADGTIILYTIDGRQTGKSIGAGMNHVAQRLIELGCVEAGLLDGGGSTSLNALYIGDESVSQINSPSDGSQRNVTNYIMLVTRAGPTGQAARLGVYPYDVLMLSGATQSFKVKAADSSGYAVSTPEFSFSLEKGLGSIGADGIFTAGASGGDETLTAAGGGIDGFATIKVVDTPHSITIYNESDWKAVSSLRILRGGSINLYAASAYNHMTLVSKDSCYTWEVTGNIGTIDQNGIFTAVNKDGSGTIKITAGQKTVSIPVSVVWDNPFTDVKEGDWFYSAIRDSYDSGLMKGLSDTKFAPSSGMTRAMFVTLLSRMDGITPSGAKSSFKDVPAGQWYTDAVIWASENGIVSGYDNGNFHPHAHLTREQLCTLILRYTNYLGKTLPSGSSGEPFADASYINSYAREGVNACKNAGLVNGKDGNKFDPQGGATRAEVAAIIQRLLSKI